MTSPKGAATTASEQHRHGVLLYEDETYLVGAIGEWAEVGLRAGDGVILIARSGLCAQVRAWLLGSGTNPASFEQTGRLRMLDADATLRLFMQRGHPQANLFQNAVAPLLEDVRRNSPSGEVRAWGEMVDLLWRRAQGPAAVELEHLWNGLLETHAFHLFCAYHADPFDAQQFPKVRAIAATHGVLLPAEDETRLATAIDHALDEVYGEEAPSVRRMLAAAPDPALPLPYHRLLALHDLAPEFAAIIAARAGQAYRGAS